MKRFGFALACAAMVLALAFGFTVYFRVEGQQHVHKTSQPIGDEPSAASSATVSFGGWMTDRPLDRFLAGPSQFPRNLNHHRLTPDNVTITEGGTVNFIIGGFHVVAVYGDDKKPSDIKTNILTSVANPPGPPIISDPDRLVYRGLDPSLLPPLVAQDRVEVVNFNRPGTYLVICAVLPHFQEGMYGFVTVVPASQ
jgi:plastocyanin